MADPIRILIVDDHAVVRKGLAMVLRLEPDLEVVGEAANGRAGLEAARILNPDIVLVDLVMPEMDGQEMAPGATEVSSPCKNHDADRHRSG